MSYSTISDSGQGQPLQPQPPEGKTARSASKKSPPEKSQKAALHKKLQEADAGKESVSTKRLLGTTLAKGSTQKRKREESAMKVEGIMQGVHKRAKVEEKGEQVTPKLQRMQAEAERLIKRTKDPIDFSEHKSVQDDYQTLLVKICEHLNTVPPTDRKEVEQAYLELLTPLTQAFQELESKTLLTQAQTMLDLLQASIRRSRPVAEIAKMKESLITYFSSETLHQSRVLFLIEKYELANSPIGSLLRQESEEVQARRKVLEANCAKLAANCTLYITSLLLECEQCVNSFKELKASASENWVELQENFAALQIRSAALLGEISAANHLLALASHMASQQLFSSASAILDPQDPTISAVGKQLEKQHLAFQRDDGKVEIRMAPSHFTFIPEMAAFDRLKSSLMAIQTQLQVTFVNFKAANDKMQSMLYEWEELIDRLNDCSSLVEANHLTSAQSVRKELLLMEAKVHSQLQACMNEQLGKNLLAPAYKISLGNFVDTTEQALRDSERELTAAYKAERMELSALLQMVTSKKSLDQEDLKLLGYISELARFLAKELSTYSRFQKEIEALERIKNASDTLLKQEIPKLDIAQGFEIVDANFETQFSQVVFIQAISRTFQLPADIQQKIVELTSVAYERLLAAKELPEVGEDRYQFCLCRLSERRAPLTSAKKSRFWMQRDLETRHVADMSERWKSFFRILFPAMQLSAMTLGFLADVDARQTKLLQKQAVEKENQSQTIMSTLLEDKLDEKPRWNKELIDSLARKGKLTEKHAQFLNDLSQNETWKASIVQYTAKELTQLCEGLGMSKGAVTNVVRYLKGSHEPTLATHSITQGSSKSTVSDLTPHKVDAKPTDPPRQAYYPSQVGTLLSPSLKDKVEAITQRPLDRTASKSSDLLLYELFYQAEHGNAKELDWVIRNIRSGWSPRERQAQLLLRKAVKLALDSAKENEVIITLQSHLNELRKTSRYAKTQGSQATESLTTYMQLTPEQQHLFKNPKIALLTAYTLDNPNRVRLSKAVSHNQHEYADRCGYQYVEHERNLAVEKTQEGTEIVWEPYWAKIVGINRILEAKEEAIGVQPEWIVWLDDDAIIGNKEIRFEDIIMQHTKDNPDIHVIITQDSMSHQIPSIPLNSAVLIIKNNQWSREFFQRVWAMRNVNVPGQSYTYGNCKNQICLHEQQAITDIYQSDRGVQAHLKIVSQRNEHTRVGMNTFSRETHYDVKRGFTVNYDNDLPSSKAQTGDFIIQCTGLATQGTLSGSQEVRNLREECVMRELAKST